MQWPRTAAGIRRLYFQNRITLSEAQRLQAYRRLFWRETLGAVALLTACYILAVALLAVHP